MKKMVKIRKFHPDDAVGISNLIRADLVEVNDRDYPPDMIQGMIAIFTAEKIQSVAAKRDMIVALARGQVVGTPRALKMIMWSPCLWTHNG
jgi:hypothetical protein